MHEDDVGVGNVPEATHKRIDTQSNWFHLKLLLMQWSILSWEHRKEFAGE